MLTQLTNLSVEADGRYATSEELQFLKDYLQSIDERVSAYEKLRDAEKEIIEQVQTKVKAINPKFFRNASGDCTQACQKEIRTVFRYIAATLLFDDQKRLREGMLLWHNTLVRSHRTQGLYHTIFKLMPEIVDKYLVPSEAALLSPIVTLCQFTLGSTS